VYALKRAGSKLYQSLRFSHKTKRQSRNTKQRRGLISHRKLIHERQQEVEFKTNIGHWEGDTVEGQ
jgi:IS30 family transposase